MNKRVLIISNYTPPSIGGGPQMLGNILRPINSQYYHILTSFANINHKPTKNNDWLPGKYIFYDNPKKTKNDPILKKDSSRVDSMFITRFLKHLTGLIKTIKESFLIINAGIKIIKDEKIDSIVATSDYGPSFISAYFLHKKTGRDLIPILFDIYKGNSHYFGNNLLASFFEPRIIQTSKKIIVNNEGTKDLYIERYGVDVKDKIHIIHNSVFPELYSKIDSTRKQEVCRTIIFTGGIYWPQIQSLKNMIKAVNELNDVQIKIYTPTPTSYLRNVGIEDSNKVEIAIASPDEIPRIQSQADILFLPLSWNSRSQEIIDTATPGKLTDYLIANRPILIHAPASSFLVKYAKENNFAHIVDEKDIDKLKQGTMKIITDTDYSNNLVKNAKMTFYKNHDANKNSRRFEELIMS